jgi:hypothetical protein
VRYLDLPPRHNGLMVTSWHHAWASPSPNSCQLLFLSWFPMPLKWPLIWWWKCWHLILKKD